MSGETGMKRAFSSFRFAAVAIVAATLLAMAGHASAQQKLRVGKAQADSFSFVPVDIGIEHGFFSEARPAGSRAAWT